MKFMIHEAVTYICKIFYNEKDYWRSKALEKCDKTHGGSNKAANDLKEILSFLAETMAPKSTFFVTRRIQDFVDANGVLLTHKTNILWVN